VTVTRSDLSPGQQAVQAGHAAINFCFEHPARASPWFKDSNTLAYLQVDNEKALKELIYKARDQDITMTIFREPDLNNSITSIALEPGMKTQKLTSKLKLLFYEKSKKSTDQVGHQSHSFQQIES
jgi:peptidyl-tRNA hydrolase